MSAVTKWFSMKKQPKRIGMYEMRLFGTESTWSKWNGNFWCMTDSEFKVAKKHTQRSYSCYNLEEVSGWRGLAASPTEGKEAKE